jgi:hypothetical protein
LANQELDANSGAFASLRNIFLSDFYLAAYPDVAAAGSDPWEHFSKHGIFEGRSPSPYLDPAYLANILALPASNVLIEMFSNKKYWGTNTSPYVDIENFVVNGPWDGVTHPLEQIVVGNLNVEPWVKYGNSYSDLAQLEEKNQRLLALSILRHVNGRKFMFSAPREFLLAEGELGNITFDEKDVVFCIPGFGLCAQGLAHSVAENGDVLSPDKSSLKHGRNLFLLESGESVNSTSIAIAPSNLRLNEATDWVRKLEPDSVVVPASADQEVLLRHCVGLTKRANVSVLSFGVQYQIVCERITSFSPVSKSSRRLFRSPERLRRKSLIVIAETNESFMANQAEVLKLVKRGARLCVSNNQSVPLWIDEINRAKVLIVCGNIPWLDLWIKKSVPIIGLADWVNRE